MVFDCCKTLFSKGFIISEKLFFIKLLLIKIPAFILFFPCSACKSASRLFAVDMVVKLLQYFIFELNVFKVAPPSIVKFIKNPLIG